MTTAPTRPVVYPDGTEGGYAETVPDHADPDRRATAAEIEAAHAWVDAQSADWVPAFDNDTARQEMYDTALAVLRHSRQRLDAETLAAPSVAVLPRDRIPFGAGEPYGVNTYVGSPEPGGEGDYQRVSVARGTNGIGVGLYSWNFDLAEDLALTILAACRAGRQWQKRFEDPKAEQAAEVSA